MLCRELSKWHIRPPGMKGRAVAEGLPDGEDVPRYFAVHKHGQDIGWVYKDAVHAKALGVWTTRSMQQLHTVLTSMRAVRTGLAPGERVPEWLTLSNFHAHIILSNCCWQQHAALNAPPDQLVLFLLSLHVSWITLLCCMPSHHTTPVAACTLVLLVVVLSS